MRFAAEVLAVLVCPDCRSKLDTLHCAECDRSFVADGEVPDLRPRRRHLVDVAVPVGGEPLDDVEVAPALPTGRSEVDFSGVAMPQHMTERVLSHFPRAAREGALMLDLGCGDGRHRSIGQHAGYTYVGVDYGAEGADMHADAHRLPFADDSFDFVLSVAVFEHLRWPSLAALEVARVLRPGGVFLGSVAFAEPFHQASYYHHTHLGMANNLSLAGLRLRHLAADPDWTVLRIFGKNALFPRMPGWLRAAIIGPLDVLHRVWWSAGRRRSPAWTETRRLTLTTGNWAFVATKD